ncbi:ribonuclease 3 isoform X1, partial [Tachysurus ichikawai]
RSMRPRPSSEEHETQTVDIFHPLGQLSSSYGSYQPEESDGNHVLPASPVSSQGSGTLEETKRPSHPESMDTFIAALYIDKDLEYVHTFMNVCFFPRLKEFILNQDWNDPKSQLQQCCLTLRTEGKEPDIPLYKTLQTVGPSHARTYTVAVYFKGERIGCGKGPSIQQAEMGAAMDALEK